MILEAEVAAATDKIASNLEWIREHIQAAAGRAGRASGDITIVAVAKTVPVHVVVQAIEAGITVIGENRVQEAEAKIPQVTYGEGKISWHFVGHLQTNKVRTAVQLFDLIESIDSVRLAQGLDRLAGELHYKVPVLIEVNTSGEASKYGFDVGRVIETIEPVMSLSNLSVQGLMTIGPPSGSETATREAFRALANLRDGLASRYPKAAWGTLSMGMSEDYEIAVEEGATLIRLGRAIFGPRR